VTSRARFVDFLHSEADRGVALLALGEVVGEILSDRSGHDLNHAGVGLLARALTHHGEHARADRAVDIELAAHPRRMGVRPSDVSARVAGVVGECNDAQQRAVAAKLDLHALTPLAARRE
jgi:hypothetical protein